MAAQKEFAPGIPASRVVQPLPRLKEPERWEFGVHRHLAERAGEHFDLRLGDPSAGHAHSWALRRLPGPGEGALAVQQPTHTLPYMDFKGSIVKGYGRGEVELARRDKAEVLSADKNKLRFNIYPGKEVEEYLLVRGKGEGNQWYLRNVTLSRKEGPGQVLPSSKPKYKVVPERKLGIDDPRSEIEAKIDGAHVFYHFKSPGTTPRVTSYRPTERATGIIDHTQKLEGFHKRTTPSTLGDTILRGELYAVDKKGKALPAARVGGILNANVWKSREKQKQEGKIVPVAFDVVRWKGQNVENYPFRDKKLMLQEATKKAPWIGQPRSARTPEEKRRLIEDIRTGKEPSTEEGVVEWKDDQSTPIKTKFLQERDVYLRNVVKERGKHQREMAGAFEFSYTKKGPIIGRVGGGMTHALKKDMLERPGLYKGLKVRIESQRAPAHYAPRSAQFISFHLDQDLPEGIKTAVDKKEYRKTRGVLLHKGIPIVRSLPKSPEKARDKLRSAIVKSDDPWSHPQVAVKSLDLDRLGFVPTRQAVPLPGEKPLSLTWRSGDLHAHKVQDYYLVHRDAVSPGGGVVSLMGHGVRDVPIALWTRFVKRPPPPILTKTAEAEARVVPHKEGKGYVIEKLYTPPDERGNGAARAKLREIKKQYKGKDLWIRPRPFGDMPVDLSKLKRFYESEGFKVVDKKDNMLLKSAAESKAKKWADEWGQAVVPLVGGATLAASYPSLKADVADWALDEMHGAAIRSRLQGTAEDRKLMRKMVKQHGGMSVRKTPVAFRGGYQPEENAKLVNWLIGKAEKQDPGLGKELRRYLYEQGHAPKGGVTIASEVLTPPVLAHELGHARIHRSLGGKVLTYLGALTGKNTRYLGAGLGGLVGMKTEPGTPESVIVPLIPLALHSPQLASEAGASAIGLSKLRRAGASGPMMRSAYKQLGKALSTYGLSVLPTFGLTMAGYGAARLGKKMREGRETKKTAQPNGEYKGQPSSPDSVKKIVPFMGLEIRVERPKGFIQRGFDAKGQYWERKYQLDYGHIKGTKGGDGDGLDVFLGPDKKADEAYWAIKLKDDGSFDEYKVFLGFPNREGAISAFKQHIPQKMLKGMVTMKVNMMKSMLGIEPLEKLGMVASFMDELEKMGEGAHKPGVWEQRAPWYTTALGSTMGAGLMEKLVPKKHRLLGMAGGAVLGTGLGLHGGEVIGRHIDTKSKEGA